LDDATLTRLKSIGDLIVDAELAAQKLRMPAQNIATFPIFVSWILRTPASPRPVVPVPCRLNHLETLNLTSTSVDDAGELSCFAAKTLRSFIFSRQKSTFRLG